MNKSLPIRDLIYFDFEKASSIWSQFQGGLRERMEVVDEGGKKERQSLLAGIPKILSGETGQEAGIKRSILQSKVLHHDLLQHVERGLNSCDLILDFLDSEGTQPSSGEEARTRIMDFPYLRIEGNARFEDYRRMLTIMKRYEDLASFIFKSAAKSVRESEEYQEAKGNLVALREDMKSEKDRNAKAKKKAIINAAETALESMVEEPETLDPWLLDGIQLWISTFAEKRTNLRIYPFPDSPEFEVVCNLKRDCFVDQDLEHLLYGYGTQPDRKLGVFGLVTSLPAKSEEDNEPEGEEEEEDGDGSMEKAFRNIFTAIDGLEAYMRPTTYPNVILHPIAVYQPLRGPVGGAS